MGRCVLGTETSGSTQVAPFFQTENMAASIGKTQVTVMQTRRVLAGQEWSFSKETSHGLEDRGMVYGKT